MTFVDAVNFLIRNVVRQALDMPANSVRPANQSYPVGKADEEFATVLLKSSEDSGWPDVVLSDNEDGTVEYALDNIVTFTASIQFFKSAETTDAAGIPKYSSKAFDRAIRLCTRLQLPTIDELLYNYGLGFVSHTNPQNLTAEMDTMWESRGAVDITFGVANRETATAAIYEVSNINLWFEPPGGPTDYATFEVKS